MSPIAGILPAASAIVKIIAAKLIEENERPVNGALTGPRRGSDPGANRAQQERRKMRMIGGLRSRLARRLRCLGAADRGGPGGRRWDRRRKGRRGLLRLRAGAATATAGAAGFAFTARLAGFLCTVTRVFARTFP